MFILTETSKHAFKRANFNSSGCSRFLNLRQIAGVISLGRRADIRYQLVLVMTTPAMISSTPNPYLMVSVSPNIHAPSKGTKTNPKAKYG